MTSPKLTPTMRKRLEAIEAAGGEMAGQGSTFRKLLDMGYLHCGRCSVTHTITAEGRKALADLAAKDAAVKAKPLTTAEIDALWVAIDNDVILQCVVSGTWSTSHGRTGSFPSRIVNLLIGRGMLKKLDADTAQITAAGQDALAKIKEAANG
jgi:hypothetical protein